MGEPAFTSIDYVPASGDPAPEEEENSEEDEENPLSNTLKDTDRLVGGSLEDVAANRGIRGKIGKIVNSFQVIIIVLALILIDIILLIVELSRDASEDKLTEDTSAIDVVGFVILILLLLEVVFRMIHLGLAFFKSPFNVLDFIVMIVSVIVTALSEKLGRFLVLLRIVRIVRVFYKIYTKRNEFQKRARQFVSANRRRFKDENGFDIDITYVTPRILAMSVPAVGKEAIYRNPVEEVARFFNTRHRGHYKIYNLCAEREYPIKDFTGEVCRWPMADHNVVPLKTIKAFCEDAYTWMHADPLHVMSIHCKGGKGRTGTMVCSYMLWDKIFPRADDALRFFAERRTADDSDFVEGVETPSQARYVHYFEEVVRSGALPVDKPIMLDYLRIYHVSPFCNEETGKLEMWAEVTEDLVGKGVSRQHRVVVPGVDCDAETAELPFESVTGGDLLVKGDIKVTVYVSKDDKAGKKKEVFAFWLHTAHSGLSPFFLPRESIDGVHKHKHLMKYTDELKIELFFKDPTSISFV